MSISVTMGNMEFHGFLWEFVCIYRDLWECMEVYGILDKYK